MIRRPSTVNRMVAGSSPARGANIFNYLDVNSGRTSLGVSVLYVRHTCAGTKKLPFWRAKPPSHVGAATCRRAAAPQGATTSREMREESFAEGPSRSASDASNRSPAALARRRHGPCAMLLRLACPRGKRGHRVARERFNFRPQRMSRPRTPLPPTAMDLGAPRRRPFSSDLPIGARMQG
jgi:hypothetical protein